MTQEDSTAAVSVSRRAVLGGLGGAAMAAGVASGGRAEAAEAEDSLSLLPSDGRSRSGFTSGVGAHFWQDKGELQGNFEVMAQMGATSFRDETPWVAVEPEKGTLTIPEKSDAFIRAAVRHGIDPLLILDYANPFYDNGARPTSPEAIEGFVRYSEFVARHFKGIVATYEVWNEWNIPIGGVEGLGDPADYVRLLAAVYPRLKAVDPRITVVGGSVAGLNDQYIDGLLVAGVLDHCDIFSVHPYIYGDLPLERRRPEVWWQHMQDLQAKLHQYTGGRDFPVYVTEIGWPTQIDSRGVSQELAAAYCARLYLLARTLPYIRGIWWYDFQDDAWDYQFNEANFGLVRPDLTPKEAYYAYRSVSNVVRNGSYLGRLDTDDENIWALRFSSPRTSPGIGPDVVALWSAAMDDDWSVVLRNDRAGNLSGERPRVAVTQAGRPALLRHWGRRPWYDDVHAAVIPDELEVTLRRAPLLLEGRLDQVTVTQVTERPFPEGERNAGACRSGPDMVITDITSSPANPKVGDHVVFGSVVRNQGDEATPDGVITGVSFEVDHNQVAWSDVLTESIPPGGTAVATANAGPTGTSSWVPTAAGSYEITAIVNDILRYPESNETNNTYTETVTVGA